MAVPAHDERDFAFAQKFGLPIRQVVAPAASGRRRAADAAMAEAYIAHTDDEVLVNSDRFSGFPAPEGARAIVHWLEDRGQGKVHRHVPPARLADQPPALLGHADPGHLLRHPRHRAGARGPAAGAAARHRRLPGQRREPAHPRRRRSSTRPAPSTAARPAARPTRWTRSSTPPGTGSATSSPHKADGPVDTGPRGTLEPGRPVHGRRRARRHAPAVLAVLHEGDVATSGIVQEREPFRRLFNQGQILGADGERMSKSRGNVQDPDELVAALRRGHGPTVPDVHGPLGPGRPVEPDRDRRRRPLPQPRLDAGAGPDTASSRAIPTPAPARRPGLRGGRHGDAHGRPPNAARRSPRSTRGSAGTRWSPT